MSNGTYTSVSVGNWIVTYILLCIPIVNIVLLFVWAFGSNTPESKANWAKAMLLLMLIGIAFYVVLFVVLGGAALFVA